MKPEPAIAVTGVGCLCAAGSNFKQCMGALFCGSCVPNPPTRFSSDHPTAYPVFEILELPPPVGSNDPQPDIMLTARFALRAAEEALGNAGLNRKILQAKRVGICIGTTVGSAMNNEEFYREYRSSNRPQMAAIHRFLNSNPARAIADHYGLSGPCQTVVNACSSGTDAIGLGAAWIRSGICDIVIAGGADELCRVTYNGFISLMITDELPCRPFDVDRKGLNLGEGAAMVVLESEALCRERNQPPRALFLGYGSACDAYHLTAPAPDGRGLKQAIAAAMAACHESVDNIAFINAHGTGTADNDRVESLVLNELLAGAPFLSTKGLTGHTLGAAGAIEAAFTIGCLEAEKIPASMGFATPDPNLAAVPVQKESAVIGTIAMSQSLAFGGNNAALIFGKGVG